MHVVCGSAHRRCPFASDTTRVGEGTRGAATEGPVERPSSAEHCSEATASNRSCLRLALAVSAAALVVGIAATAWFFNLGQTLADPDARAHLVVAERVLDSRTPGPQQLGTVWLPLLHLLLLLPVQHPTLYSTGLAAAFVSVPAFAILCGATAATVYRLSGSVTASVLGASILATNPNLLYLQATAMTEPLVLSALAVGLAALVPHSPEGRGHWWLGGLALAAACLTRYEAWIASLGVVVALAAARPAVTRGDLVRVALPPVTACALFALFSYWTSGHWLVTSGFYEATNTSAGSWMAAFGQLARSLNRLAGLPLVLLGVVGFATLFHPRSRVNERAPALMLAVGIGAGLPAAAAFVGHPFHTRYAVFLLLPLAVVTGLFAAESRTRLCLAATVILVTGTAQAASREAPAVVAEARARDAGWPRQWLLEPLGMDESGSGVMISMASSAHIVHEMQAAGVQGRDLVHEGNGRAWLDAVASSSAATTWVVVNQQVAGDPLAALIRRRPSWLDAFELFAHDHDVWIYKRRDARALHVARSGHRSRTP